MSSPTPPPKFHISLIGSGPISKLLLSAVEQHPRIEYSCFEADTLPLRPSFGYGIGPQTLIATKRLDEEIGDELHKRCLLTPVWMEFWDGCREGEKEYLGSMNVPPENGGVYGRVGREELMGLLDDFMASRWGGKPQYGMKVKALEKVDENSKEKRELKLTFEDGTSSYADAIWACDGMNSLGRKIIQGAEFQPAVYSGHVTFRGKVPATTIAEFVGKRFANDTTMFMGNKWHILIFPIDGGEFINIAAFAMEKVQKRRGRDYKTSTEELLGYFKGANEKIVTLLKLLNSTPGGCICLELTYMPTLSSFHNPSLNITTFGDAANGMLPHIAGSMSTGVIGVATFLKDSLNPRISKLSSEASNHEIANMLKDAATEYEKVHLPLAQKMVDMSREQGAIWSGGVGESGVDVEKLSLRAKVLWGSAGQPT